MEPTTKHKPIHLAYGDDPLQFGELYMPVAGTQPYPLVILIHGGFWRTGYGLSLMEGLAQDLAREGIAAWNIEYRRVGDNSGGWPGTLLDVAQATDYVKTLATMYGIDLQRVVTVGHSAGGHLALWLGARTKLAKDSPLGCETPLMLKGAVSLAGAMDLRLVWQLHLGNDAAAALLSGSPDEVPERYQAASPAEQLPLGIPQVLLHGTDDDRVPLFVSQEYADKARKAGDTVTLLELPDVDHFAFIDPTSITWHTTLAEIHKLLPSITSQANV